MLQVKNSLAHSNKIKIEQVDNTSIGGTTQKLVIYKLCQTIRNTVNIDLHYGKAFIRNIARETAWQFLGLRHKFLTTSTNNCNICTCFNALSSCGLIGNVSFQGKINYYVLTKIYKRYQGSLACSNLEGGFYACTTTSTNAQFTTSCFHILDATKS